MVNVNNYTPFPNPNSAKFTFIDLFAGVGGFRLSLRDLGGACVFSSEIDKNAQKTYLKNFGDLPFGDITSESVKSEIPPNFDILCGGFPCQAFSVAGYRKGFDDTRGTLFFDVATIVQRHRPKVVFLENVKNLVTHDKGKTFRVIKTTLENMGYVVNYGVFNAMDYANVPQNRERVFIVCFDPAQVKDYNKFAFPRKIPLTKTIRDYIDTEVQDEKFYYTEKFKHYSELIEVIKSQQTIYQWRRQYVRENKSNVCPTLTANMGTGGHNVPLILTNGGIRKLTPRECFNFQGFSTEFILPDDLPNSKLYIQAGNSVVVPMVTLIAKEILRVICND